MFAVFGKCCCCAIVEDHPLLELVESGSTNVLPQVNSLGKPGEGQCGGTQRPTHVEAYDEKEENGSDGQFLMEVEMHTGELFGVDFYLTPSKSIKVVSITAGVANDWNHGRAVGQRRLQEGDQIVEVNGMCKPHDMLVCLREPSLRIVVKPRKEFDVVIVKENERLGIDVNMKKERRYLIVSKIVEGPVVRWNEETRTRQVNVKDHIVEINGFRGDGKELLERLKLAETLRMSVVSFQ
jgi:hypothetical protein